jgi:hypothetical protein
MENLFIFTITLSFYFGISYLIKKPKNLFKRLTFISFLTIPA